MMRLSKEGRLITSAPRHERIAVNSDVMGGKPCIKGTRIPVDLIVEKLGHGQSGEEILEAYPGSPLRTSVLRKPMHERCRKRCSMPWSPISTRSR